MAIVGVICEYNPFHLGHEKQFRQIRERFGADTAIVCLMSGNFVQRGKPAVFDKLVRAAMAVECGASLVLELPVTGVLRSAEGFARCGVEILNTFGVEYLAFGCESWDETGLLELAEGMATPNYAAALQAALQGGVSYAAAREQAARVLGLRHTLLQRPNDILALEYCRALRGTGLRPAAFWREGDYHSTIPDRKNPSATAVRERLTSGGDWAQFTPQPAAACARGAAHFSLHLGEQAMLARLRGLRKEDWAHTAHGTEGLWSLAWRASGSCRTLEELENAVKSKRYPMTRVRRLLLCAYLGLTEDDLRREIPYVRALAMDKTGRGVLRQMRKTGTIPLINAGQTPEDSEYFELECRAAALHGLFCAEAGYPAAQQLRAERIYLKQEDAEG